MKIAIVQDELIRRGGAEQVTLLMHAAFPDAPIYTSSYSPEDTYDAFKKCDIRMSWFGHFAKSENMLKAFFYPFSIWAMRNIKLQDYDVVFISTTNCAKFVSTNPDNLFIAFCHFPFRLAWYPDSYNQVKKSKGIMRFLYMSVINRLKKLDYDASKKINWFITNTPDIKERIEGCYHPQNEVSVIPASIPCRNFFVADCPTEDYYLIVSRFEPYKKIEMAIESFNSMPDKKLIIVGKGSLKPACILMAKKNISFLENVSSSDISKLYSNCKAFIFPQEEDYGLTPLEANASGRPVIAFGKGGITNTMIPYTNNSKKSTAVFFDEQTAFKLQEAIILFETLAFDPIFIRQHAEEFDEDVFIDKIRKFVIDKYGKNKSAKLKVTYSD